jgi:hypothetical protein
LLPKHLSFFCVFIFVFSHCVQDKEGKIIFGSYSFHVEDLPSGVDKLSELVVSFLFFCLLFVCVFLVSFFVLFESTLCLQELMINLQSDFIGVLYCAIFGIIPFSLTCENCSSIMRFDISNLSKLKKQPYFFCQKCPNRFHFKKNSYIDDVNSIAKYLLVEFLDCTKMQKQFICNSKLKSEIFCGVFFPFVFLCFRCRCQSWVCRENNQKEIFTGVRLLQK